MDMFLRTCMDKIMSTDGNQTDRKTNMSGRVRQYTPELRSQYEIDNTFNKLKKIIETIYL